MQRLVSRESVRAFVFRRIGRHSCSKRELKFEDTSHIRQAIKNVNDLKLEICTTRKADCNVPLTRKHEKGLRASDLSSLAVSTM